MFPDHEEKTGEYYLRSLVFFVILLVLVPAVTGSGQGNPSTSTLLSVLTQDSGQYYPMIYGETVIWVDSPGSGYVHRYNTSSGQETILISDNIPSDGMHPDIYDHYIAWISGDYPDYKVILHDIASGEEVRLAGGNETAAWNPDIGDGLVVWQENSIGSLDIYVKSIATGEEMLLASDALNTG